MRIIEKWLDWREQLTEALFHKFKRRWKPLCWILLKLRILEYKPIILMNEKELNEMGEEMAADAAMDEWQDRVADQDWEDYPRDYGY